MSSQTTAARVSMYENYPVKPSNIIDLTTIDLNKLVLDDSNEQQTITLQQHNEILQHHIDLITDQYITQSKQYLFDTIDITMYKEYIKHINERLQLQSSIQIYKQQLTNIINNKLKHNELNMLIEQQIKTNNLQQQYNSSIQHDPTNTNVFVTLQRYEQHVVTNQYNIQQQYIWYQQQLQSNTILLQQSQSELHNSSMKYKQLENKLITQLHDYKHKIDTIKHQLDTFDDISIERIKRLDIEIQQHNELIQLVTKQNNDCSIQLSKLNEQIQQLNSVVNNKTNEYTTIQQQYDNTIQQCNSNNNNLFEQLSNHNKYIYTTLNHTIQSTIKDVITALTDTIRLDLVCKQCYELLSQPVLLQPCNHTLCRKCIQPYRIDVTSNTVICPECQSQYQHTLNNDNDDLFNTHVILDGENDTLYHNPYFNVKHNETYTDGFVYNDNNFAAQLLTAYNACVDMIECTMPLLQTSIQKSQQGVNVQSLIDQLKYDIE